MKPVLAGIGTAIVVFTFLTYIPYFSTPEESYTDIKIIKVEVRSDSLTSEDLKDINTIFNRSDVVVIYRRSLNKVIKITE